MAYRATALGGGRLLPVIYVVVGAFVAGSNHYFTHVSHIAGVVNALLAMFLWPLVLFGVHFQVS
jgi:hypothetical protein